MLILGIDPGIGRTGWGIIESNNNKFKAIAYDCIETPANSEIQTRLLTIFEHIDKKIKEYNPEIIAVEELFFNTNAKTALVVGHARGVILLAGAMHNLPITKYTPLQVKIALTGYGRAEKSQIGQMVKTILGLSSIPKPDDVTDSLAVALTHAFSSKMTSIKK